MIYDSISKPEVDKTDIVTVFMALQEQNFVLANSLTNLVKKWPKTPIQPITKEELLKSGTLFVIKN
tara:strand:+ start:324 stop:521 length:198 start_codon:yes stop_codon:yes gene_type:complete